ncbi:hypothetical protein CEXT_459031 [Caerostris extrusa]|uniref:Uncharacterized protein n=1 Tax=Caerostris extrusa TaxID=172846 RepID=A0AAV4Y8I2_CAEEX|nr:hypothetical protein CEXT_459031 [Caerostris extrusa]
MPKKALLEGQYSDCNSKLKSKRKFSYILPNRCDKSESNLTNKFTEYEIKNVVSKSLNVALRKSIENFSCRIKQSVVLGRAAPEEEELS